jgi:hypothetical protein
MICCFYNFENEKVFRSLQISFNFNQERAKCKLHNKEENMCTVRERNGKKYKNLKEEKKTTKHRN